MYTNTHRMNVMCMRCKQARHKCEQHAHCTAWCLLVKSHQQNGIDTTVMPRSQSLPWLDKLGRQLRLLWAWQYDMYIVRLPLYQAMYPYLMFELTTPYSSRPIHELQTKHVSSPPQPRMVGNKPLPPKYDRGRR